MLFVNRMEFSFKPLCEFESQHEDSLQLVLYITQIVLILYFNIEIKDFLKFKNLI